MASLEGWGSTIELRPHAPRWRDHSSLPAARSTASRERWSTQDPGRRVGCARHQSVQRGVAQLGSALALGARGRGFKSRHPDQADPCRPGSGQAEQASAPGCGIEVLT